MTHEGKSVVEPELRQVATRIHNLDNDYLQCRTIGHAWMVGYVGPVARADSDLQVRAARNLWKPDAARILACQRCSTERIDLCVVGYDRDNYSYRMVSRQYRYQQGYRVEGAHQHRELLHQELFRRNQ